MFKGKTYTNKPQTVQQLKKNIAAEVDDVINHNELIKLFVKVQVSNCRKVPSTTSRICCEDKEHSYALTILHIKSEANDNSGHRACETPCRTDINKPKEMRSMIWRHEM